MIDPKHNKSGGVPLPPGTSRFVGGPIGKSPAKKKPKVRYWTYKGNEDAALRNGSFVRSSREGQFALYMNGDFMGSSETMPTCEPTYIEVDAETAKKLLPRCCFEPQVLWV